MVREAVVVCFKLLTQHSPGRTDQDDKRPQLECPVLWPGFD